MSRLIFIMLSLWGIVSYSYSQEILNELNIGFQTSYSENSFYHDSIWLYSKDINDDDLEGYITRAEQKINQGYYTEALMDIEKIIELDSTLSHSYLMKGIIRLQQDSLEYAHSLFNKAIKLDTLNPDIYYYLGITYLGKEDEVQAKNHLDLSIELAPEWHMGYFGMGNYYLHQKKYGKAKAFYKKSIKYYPFFDQAYINKSFCEIKLYQINLALKTYNKALESLPETAILYFLRGYVYYNTHETDKTLADWNMAVNLDSTNIFFRCYRGLLLLDLELYNDAYKDISPFIKSIPLKKDIIKSNFFFSDYKLLQAVQLFFYTYDEFSYTLNNDNCTKLEKGFGLFLSSKHTEFDNLLNEIIATEPNNSLLYFIKGYNNEFLKKNHESIECYKASLSNSPKVLESELRLGISYTRTENYNEADSIINSYITKTKADCLSLRFLGIANSNLNNYTKAIEAFSLFIEIDSTDDDIFFNRAEQYKLTQQYHEAIKDYQKVIELRPKDVTSHYSIGLCYYLLGKNNIAKEKLLETLNIYSKFEDASYLLGIIEMNNKQYDTAIAYLTNVLQTDPRHVNSLINRGLSYYELGKFEEALTDLNMAIHIDANSTLAYFNRSLVYIKLNRIELACSDLNTAADLGDSSAVETMKNICK